MTIGERIRAERKKAGLTIKELGSNIGLSGQAIVNWELGHRNPTVKSIKNMAPINPRSGVVVAITDKRGEIACYDPNAYERRDYYRNEKIRENERKGEARYAEGKTAHRKRKDRRAVESAGQRLCRSV